MSQPRTLEIPLPLSWGVHLSPLQCTARVTLIVEQWPDCWVLVGSRLPLVWHNESQVPERMTAANQAGLQWLLKSADLVEGRPITHPDILRAISEAASAPPTDRGSNR